MSQRDKRGTIVNGSGPHQELVDPADEIRLSKRLEEYLAQMERGERPDRESIVRRHPDLADQLRTCLDGLELLRHVVPELQDASEAIPAFGPEALGDFRILRELGRGGMAVVYEAEQISLGRRVALKVLPFAAMLDKHQLTRFKNEARAAATLDHPNIVAIYSVGTERGVHYYAMQLIEGCTLAEYIADTKSGRPLSLTEFATASSASKSPANDTVKAALPTLRSNGSSAFFRTAAQLISQAAVALDHAHKNGILHRDIKPANLLVDDFGKLWITDFGLARIDAGAGVTLTGDLLGTLRYMSPEQALAKRDLVDQRSDVYSLGATLYELITLQPIFAETDRVELLNRIAFDEPVSPRRINATIPVELDTIVAKAMSKEPGDRYQTAQQLADDLQAFVEHKPIKAKPISVIGRVAKWSRRHRNVAVASVIVLAFALLCSFVASTLLLIERHRTNVAAAESQAVIQFLVNDLLAAPKEQFRAERNLTVTEVLENAEKKIAGAFQDQPLVNATIRLALAKSYAAIGNNQKAEFHSQASFETRKKLLGPANHDTLEAVGVLVESLLANRKAKEALSLCQESFDSAQKSLGVEHEDTLDRMNQLVAVFLNQPGRKQEDLARAGVVNKECVRLAHRAHGERHRQTLRADLMAGGLLYIAGDHSGATDSWEKSFKLCKAEFGEADPLTMEFSSNLCDVTRKKDPWASIQMLTELLDVQRRVLGRFNLDTLWTLRTLEYAHDGAGHFQKAKELADEGLEISTRLLGGTHSETIWWLSLRGNACRGLGDFKSAAIDHEGHLKHCRDVFGNDHEKTLRALGNLGYTYKLGDRYSEALTVLNEAIAGCRRAPVSNMKKDTLRNSLQYRPQVLHFLGQAENAEQALEEYMALVGPGAGAHLQLAIWRFEAGKVSDARDQLHKAIELLDENDSYTMNKIAWLLAASKHDEVRDGDKALDLAKKANELTHYEHGNKLDTLAGAYAETGDFKSAIQWAEKAVELAQRPSQKKSTPSIWIAIERINLGDLRRVWSGFL